MKNISGASTHRFLDAAVAIWGAGIILLQVAILSVEENQFLPGGTLILVVSLAIGVLFLLAPWLQRRGGYLVLLLTVLWWLAVIWFRRDESSSFVWGLLWGAAAYALPAALLLLFSRAGQSPRLVWLAAVVAYLLLVLVLGVTLGASSGGGPSVAPPSAPPTILANSLVFPRLHRTVRIRSVTGGGGSAVRLPDSRPLC